MYACGSGMLLLLLLIGGGDDDVTGLCRVTWSKMAAAASGDAEGDGEWWSDENNALAAENCDKLQHYKLQHYHMCCVQPVIILPYMYVCLSPALALQLRNNCLTFSVKPANSNCNWNKLRTEKSKSVNVNCNLQVCNNCNFNSNWKTVTE